MYSVRDPWHISEAEFPRHGAPPDRLRHLLNYAVLAPPDHNTQPWRFRLTHDCIEVFADRTRALPVVDPEGRELTISCGAALYQLQLAIRHFGFIDHVELFPDAHQSDLLARVALIEPQASTAEEDQRFQAILQRRSNRSPFEDRAIPQPLVAEGDRLQFSNQAFRQELAAWIRPNGSRRRDGIPGYALGMGYVMSYLAPFVIRTFDIGSSQARKHRRLVLGSPLLAVLGTARDNPSAWLAVGHKPWRRCSCRHTRMAFLFTT